MKIEDITEAALGREDDKDLYDLRLRCVNFYKKHGFEYCNDKYMVLTRGKHV